jgi:hypothetical protein
MNIRSATAALLAISAMAFGTSANAGFVLTNSPYLGQNDCAGTFGTPKSTTETCVAPNGSPLIVKFDFNDNGGITDITTGAFGGSDAYWTSLFTFSFANGLGSWTYTPGAGDPLITAFVAKGGNDFNYYEGSGNSSSFNTPTTCGNPSRPGPCGLSHLSFYDSDSYQMPEPSTVALLGIGLLGAGVARRRKAS